MKKDRRRQSQGLTGWAQEEEQKNAPFPEAGLLKNKSTAALLPHISKTKSKSNKQPVPLVVKNSSPPARHTDRPPAPRQPAASLPKQESVVKTEEEKRQSERVITEKAEEAAQDLWLKIIRSKPAQLKKHPRGTQSQQMLHINGRYVPLKLSSLNMSNKLRAQQENTRNLIQMLQKGPPAIVDSLPKQDQPDLNVRDRITKQLRQNFIKQGLPQMRKRKTDAPKPTQSEDLQFSDSQIRLAVDHKRSMRPVQDRTLSIRVLPRLRVAGA